MSRTSSNSKLIIIPFDYEQLPEPQRNQIVPICIAALDSRGNAISSVWFNHGVVPVQDQLRNIARYKLGDVRYVSELTELTVHKLWERHGENAGACPSRRVLVRAIWEARDLAAGKPQWHIKHTVPLALELLERDIYRHGLVNQRECRSLYEEKLLLDLVEDRIRGSNRQDIRDTFRLFRLGYTWEQIATRLHDAKPDAVRKRFWRWIKRNFPKKPAQTTVNTEGVCNNEWRS